MAGKLRILPLGGLGEIGKNMTVVEYGGRIVEEPDARAEVDARIRDGYEALSVTVNPIPVKTALALLGLIPANFRLPMVPASPDEEAEVRSMLERHGLLSAV